MANRALTSETVRAATAVRSQIPGQVMIFYSWTALSDSGSAALSESDWDAPSEGDPDASNNSDPGSAGSPVAMGITDDRGRAMKAAEETLRSGQAVMVIIEAVRPAMAAHTLAPCYVRTGVGWLGRCTEAGEVTWNRFFLRANPDDQKATGRMGP
jgi:hypothetical protein